MVTVSAPGKIHFMGEHAVVYGKPALLSAIHLRLTVTMEPSTTSKDELIVSHSRRFVEQALHIVKRAYGGENKHVRITISSDIPSGYHLGSSAALAVALSGAGMQYFQGRFDKTEINTVAYEIEKIAHGTPSGGDNTICTFGGFLRFQKKSETEKTVEHLSFPFPSSLNHFFLINTGKPESTKTMVAKVREKYTENPSFMETVFAVNEKATAMILEAMKSGDERLLCAGMRVGQTSLEDMGVVSTNVQSFITTLASLGATAKILGGGGRRDGVGYLLCYISPHAKQKEIDDLLRQYSYARTPIRLGQEGVKLMQNE